MLRAAIKYGIGRALSTRPGVEIWDFDLREDASDDGVATLEIRYRYHKDCTFRATIRETDDGIEVMVEHTPGAVMRSESHTFAGIDALYAQLEKWSGFLADELVAQRGNRVLAAQQKALLQLGKHLRDLPDRPLPRGRVDTYVGRLDGLEQAVLDLRPEADAASIRQEFEGLRACAGALGERSFLQAVLVRLVQYFWDEDHLRIVEEGSQAALRFLDEQPSGAPSRSRVQNALQDQA